MIKYFIKIFIVLTFFLLLTSCSSKKSAEDYIQEATVAMNEGDYVTAYSLADKLAGIKEKKRDYWFDSARDYFPYEEKAYDLNLQIVNNEIASLFENTEDKNLFPKINKIITERVKSGDSSSNSNDKELKNKKNELLENIINMGFSINDLYLVSNLVDLYVKNNKDNYEKRENLEKHFYPAILSKMIIQDNNDKNLIIPQILMLYPLKGEKKEGIIDDRYDAKDYMNSVNQYNILCDNLVNQAISAQQFEVAQIIINSYKESGEATEGTEKGKLIKGEKVFKDKIYIAYDWKSKNAAQKKLNEAKKNNK